MGGFNMLQKLRGNSQGFTLIELMIVIAIIGILAAIAIPNFIAYRNKSYCSAAEADANSVAATIADYFAIPENTTLPTADGSGGTYLGYQLSNKGGQNLITVAGDPNNTITITVTDGSGRCDTAYKAKSFSGTGINKWQGANSNDYVKYMD
jgi:prepilin-type N-terminal cleavage/methylation domain-containing protein